jgi:hypothetical protein
MEKPKDSEPRCRPTYPLTPDIFVSPVKYVMGRINRPYSGSHGPARLESSLKFRGRGGKLLQPTAPGSARGVLDGPNQSIQIPVGAKRRRERAENPVFTPTCRPIQAPLSASDVMSRCAVLSIYQHKRVKHWVTHVGWGWKTKR